MVPSEFVLLDSLPRITNGKVDRKALPSPDQSIIGLEENCGAPRSTVEEILVGIWLDVLKLKRVGVHDNFFYIGGHSLTATQVISRIRGAFQVEIPLRALFEKPTVEELAIAIMERRGEGIQEGEVSPALAELESLSEEETPCHLVEQDK
jgi:acyl carrier protein